MDISVSLHRRVGEVKLLIDFYGERFDIDFQSYDQMNPGAAFLSKYEDKIGLTYRYRHNTIGVAAKRTYNRLGVWCLMAMAAAIIVYTVANLLNPNFLYGLFDTVIIPAERMFANAIIMIAAPVTFFSLVTNISDCYAIADNKIRLSTVAFKIFGSGILATGLATAQYFSTKWIFADSDVFTDGAQYCMRKDNFSDNLSDTIYNIVPDDIFEAFMEISPFSLLLIGILTAAALCSANKHFETSKTINDAVNALFDKMLSIIMMFLPAAAFLSMLDVLLDDGYWGLETVFAVFLLMSLGAIGMVCIAVVRVAFFGMNPVTFLKKCIPAIRENYRINSSIDAVPYNIRFCSKTFGVSVNKLEVDLPILAQVNQAGNSFMIMLTSLGLLDYVGIRPDIKTLIMLAVLIIFISLGAPGQDGSLLIGMIIIFSFAGISYDLIAVIIYVEVLMGSSLSVLNTLFDIVSVVVSDHSEKRKEARCQQ